MTGCAKQQAAPLSNAALAKAISVAGTYAAKIYHERECGSDRYRYSTRVEGGAVIADIVPKQKGADALRVYMRASDTTIIRTERISN